MHHPITHTHNYNPNTPTNHLNQPKMNSPTQFKTFDKTLPSPNIKHYASNPNLSLELNSMKSSGIMADTHPYSPTLNKKNN